MIAASYVLAMSNSAVAAEKSADAAFFEKRIRPLLVKHCYECHSEAAKEQQGGLLLDRKVLVYRFVALPIECYVV